MKRWMKADGARQQQRRARVRRTRRKTRRRTKRRARRLEDRDGTLGQGVMTRSMTKALAREREKKQLESEAGVESHVGTGISSGLGALGCQGYCKTVSLKVKIWGRLTEDLLERICARLPAACLIRLRTVSRRWSAMLTSTSFLLLYAQAPRPDPWFCMFTKIHPDASTYDPLLNQWHHVPLPPLPQRNMTAVAADGGLVCFCSLASNGNVEEMVVCNPLTQTSARVWSVPRYLGPLRRVGLLADADSKTFRLLLAFAGDDDATGGWNGPSKMFDSGSRCWEDVSPPSLGGLGAAVSDDAGGGLHNNQAVLCDGTLYWLSGSDGGLLEAFDPRIRLWTRWYVPMPAPVVYSRKLVESQSSIFMLGGLPGTNENVLITRHICIWRLQLETMQWEEVDRMPSMLCGEFIGDSTHVNFTGSTDQVLLNMRGGSRNSLMVLYDLRSRLWRRVPKCPLPDRRLVWGLKDGIAFQPKIDADFYFHCIHPSAAH